MSLMTRERKYPSTRRGSTSEPYTTRLYADGTTKCNCPGWRFVKPGEQRGCSHCEWIKQDYHLVTIGEASRLAVANIKWTKITEYPSGLWLIKRWDDSSVTLQQIVDAQEEAKRRERDRLTRKAQAAQRLRELKQRRARFNAIIGNPTLPEPVTRPVGAPETYRAGDGRRRPFPTGPNPATVPTPTQPQPDRARIAWDEEV